MEDARNDIERLAGMISDARRAVAFTGAGISTESGIPDFRSPTGIWSQAKPIYYQDFPHLRGGAYRGLAAQFLVDRTSPTPRPTAAIEPSPSWFELQGLERDHPEH